jgi:hypothetical protein
VRQRPARRGVLTTAGERVGLAVPAGRLWDLLREGSDGMLEEDAAAPTILLRVEETRRPFDTSGWKSLNRGAWQRDGAVIIEDVCTSGFDVHVRCLEDGPRFTFRWRPRNRTRVAAAALPSRAHLLTRAVLLQYPAMWWAGTKGRAPIHGAAVVAGGTSALLAGPGGVGKTTLIMRETAAGGRATGDNVSVADGVSVWGVAEPVRSEGGSGRAMPHDRRESHLENRAERIRPAHVVVLRRGPRERVRACDPEEATRALVASTYIAGELRRYWMFAALLALGTDVGPPHPPVGEVARTFADQLPCFVVELPTLEGVSLSAVLAGSEVSAWT